MEPPCYKNYEKYLLVKYEDLISDKEKTFINILKFIHKLGKINFVLDKNKLKNILDSTSFDKMQNLERDKGFKESVIKEKSGDKIKFFNLGPKNNWKKSLDLKIRKKIENSFEKELNELKYL